MDIAKRLFHNILTLLLVATFCATAEGAVRLKDLAKIDGVRSNQLIGYGLVVGLNGTGDKSGTEFTTQTTANLLQRLGVAVSPDDIKVKNVAAVIVTSDLPPFASAGHELDVTVSSMGDARSLQGGTLLLTPMRAPNGDTFAVAQGAVTVGGFSVGNKRGKLQVNHPTVGRIAGGALLERDAPLPEFRDGVVDFVLKRADFTTAARIAKSINGAIGEGVALALDAGRVRVRLPELYRGGVVGFLSALETVTVEPDQLARVVVDEKTGTVVLGRDVKVRPVAISHGNITIAVTPTLEVSQPGPFSRGTTVAAERDAITVVEQSGGVKLLESGGELASLVKALNALGVGPRDLITIFQSLEAAGALDGKLEIM